MAAAVALARRLAAWRALYATLDDAEIHSPAPATTDLRYAEIQCHRLARRLNRLGWGVLA